MGRDSRFGYVQLLDSHSLPDAIDVEVDTDGAEESPGDDGSYANISITGKIEYHYGIKNNKLVEESII